MLTPWVKTEVLFVHRRAWRVGVVDKHDLSRAFGVSAKTAQRRIHDALGMRDAENRPYVVCRPGRRGVFPNRAATRPEWASETDLLGVLPMRGDADLFFCLSGVRESELRLQRSAWVDNRPLTPGTLDEIVHALVSAPKVVDARYISLSAEDQGIRVRFVPLSIQQTGDQVAVYAYCLSKTDATGTTKAVEATQSYVLSRLSEAKVIVHRAHELRQIQMRLPHISEPTGMRRFRMNPRLTEEQVTAMRHELGLQNTDTVRRPVSELLQFLHMFSDLPAQEIWPPLLIGEDGP